MRANDWLGPLLSWELVSLGRHRRTFFLRCLYALLLLLIFWTAYESAYRYSYRSGSVLARNANFASEFFISFSILQLTAVLILTPAYVGAAIASEVERKTLEYLLAAPLSNWAIVGGKWAARLTQVLWFILTGLPVLALASLLGGIDPARLLAIAALTLLTLMATAALAICVSVYSTNTRSAVTTAFVWVILFMLLGIGIEIVSEFIQWHVKFDTFLGAVLAPFLPSLKSLRDFSFLTNPYYLCLTLLDIPADDWHRLVQMLGVFAGVMFALTTLLLGTATVRLRAAVKSRIDRAAKRTVATNKKATPRRRWFAAPAVFDPPLVWKEWFFGTTRRRNLLGGLALGVFFGSFYGMLLQELFQVAEPAAKSWSAIDRDQINAILRWYGTLLIAVCYAAVAIRAATSFTIERDRDCWVSLLTTPLTAGELLAGKMLGAAKPLILLTLFLLPAWLLGTAVDGVAAVGVILLVLTIAIHGFFLTALGTQLSLRAKSSGNALAKMFGWCFLLGGCGHMFMGFFIFTGSRTNLVEAYLLGLLPWVPLVGACECLSAIDYWFKENDAMFVGCVLAQLTYLVAAAVLLGVTRHRFALWTERAD